MSNIVAHLIFQVKQTCGNIAAYVSRALSLRHWQACLIVFRVLIETIVKRLYTFDVRVG